MVYKWLNLLPGPALLAPALYLWLWSLFMTQPWGVWMLLLAGAAARLIAPGRRFAAFSAVLLALGAGTRAFITVLSPGGSCPDEDKDLHWVSRSAAAYDAQALPGRRVLVGRRHAWGKAGLIIAGPKGERDLVQGSAFQSFARVNGVTYAADWSGNALYAFKDGKVRSLAVCRWPIDLAAYRGSLLVLCEGGRRLQAVRGFPPRRVASFNTPPEILNPYGLAVDEEGGRAFVSSWGVRGAVGVIGLESGGATGKVLGAATMGLAWVKERGELWVAQPMNSRVLRLDPRTLAPLGTLPAGIGLRRLAAGPRAVMGVSYFAGLAEAWDQISLKKVLVRPVGKLARGVRPAGERAFLVSSGCGVARLRVPVQSAPRH